MCAVRITDKSKDCHEEPLLHEMLRFALIFAAAISINFWRISEVGLTHWDEYYWIGTALRLIGRGGFFNLWEPPGFPLSVAVLLATFGAHDFIAVSASALWGVLTVLSVYLFSRNLYGWKIGVTAALTLGTTELFLVYSRMAMTDVMLSFLLAVMAMETYRAFELMQFKRFFFLGVIAALSIGVKYNGVVGLAVCYSYGLILSLLAAISRRWRFSEIELSAWRRIKKTLTGLVIVTSLPLVTYILAMAVLGSALDVRTNVTLQPTLECIKLVASTAVSDPIGSFRRGASFFWNNVVYRAHPEMRAGFVSIFRDFPFGLLRGVGYYLQVLSMWVSPATLVFLAVGVFAVLLCRERRYLFLTVWLAATFFFCAGVHVTYSRMMVPVLPPLAIMTSVGVWKLAKALAARCLVRIRVRGETVVGFALTTLVISAGFLSSLKTMNNVHDGYRRAGLFLTQHLNRGQSILILCQPVILFYLPVSANWTLDRSHINDVQIVVVDFVLCIRTDISWFEGYALEKGYVAIARFRNDVPLVVLADYLTLDGLSQTTDTCCFKEIVVYARNQSLTAELPLQFNP